MTIKYDLLYVRSTRSLPRPQCPLPLHELITALDMFLLARYKLDLAGVEEVRWDKRGTVERGVYAVLVGNSEG